MGLTISYRGSLGDLDRIEDFEDRVLDLALELGGQATVWRTANNDNPRRMVRGVILNLFPGQETVSLLVSPEGWLVNLFEIEDAELGKINEPPWCFVKTQFGPVEGHVALVELLTVLKREFFPNLDVRDEGDYWETRDLAALTAKFQYLQSAIDAMAAGLQRFGLSGEAAEDREILLSRIERIAKLVHHTLSRPAEHPPVHWHDEDAGEPFGEPRHPLQQLARDLMLRLHNLLKNTATSTNSHRDILMHGAGEISGGLAQALSADDMEPPVGLSLVQLKRALRGAAFASGALYPLRTDGTLDQASFDELQDTIEKLQDGIYAELGRLRGRRDEE